MKRVHNFNAGPSALPLPALELARDELFDFEGSGMSIMEHSHRSKEYERVHTEVRAPELLLEARTQTPRGIPQGARHIVMAERIG